MNLKSLNEQQKKAVEHVKGPSMIVAGAGSGKTRVLTYKVIVVSLQQSAEVFPFRGIIPDRRMVQMMRSQHFFRMQQREFCLFDSNPC